MSIRFLERKKEHGDHKGACKGTRTQSKMTIRESNGFCAPAGRAVAAEELCTL